LFYKTVYQVIINKSKFSVTSPLHNRHITERCSENRMTINEYNLAVTDYSDRLFRFVVKSIRDVHKAEDIVQDSFEKLWKNIENVDGKKVKSYLFTTAYHTLIDNVRKDKRSSFYEDMTMNEEGHESTYSDLSEILNEVVQKLPEVQRVVLLLRDYEGYSYQEIGELTNLNESQVKVYIYRARIFLKKYLVKMDLVV